MSGAGARLVFSVPALQMPSEFAGVIAQCLV